MAVTTEEMSQVQSRLDRLEKENRALNKDLDNQFLWVMGIGIFLGMVVKGLSKRVDALQNKPVLIDVVHFQDKGV